MAIVATGSTAEINDPKAKLKYRQHWDVNYMKYMYHLIRKKAEINENTPSHVITFLPLSLSLWRLFVHPERAVSYVCVNSCATMCELVHSEREEKYNP